MNLIASDYKLDIKLHKSCVFSASRIALGRYDYRSERIQVYQMVYRVHTKLAQQCLFKDNEIPQEIIKPDSMKKEPNFKRIYNKMVRSWDKTRKSKI